MISAWYCPLCGEEITREDDQVLFPPGVSAGRTEEALREHLRDRHPIRRRVIRKYRRAMKASVCNAQT